MKREIEANGLAISKLLLPESLFTVFPAAINAATKDASRKVLMELQTVERYPTCKAIFRKRGEHTDCYGGYFNINRRFARPFLGQISPRWGALFGKLDPEALNNGLDDIEQRFNRIIGMLWPSLKVMGLSNSDRRYLELLAAAIALEAKEGIKGVVEEMKISQRKISRTIEGTVKKELSRTYEEIATYAGSNSMKRMKAQLAEVVEKKKLKLFIGIAEAVKDELLECFLAAEAEWDAVLEECLTSLRDELTALCAPSAKKATPGTTKGNVGKIKVEVGNILRVAHEELDELLKVKEDDDGMEIESSEEEDEEEEEEEEKAQDFMPDFDSEFDFGPF